MLAVMFGGVLSLAAGPRTTADGDALKRALREADQALAEKRYPEAETRFKEVLQEHPGAISAYRGLARARAAVGKKSEAAALLLEVGVRADRLGLRETARDLLLEAASTLPESPETQLEAGRSLYSAKHYQDAALHLRQAIELGADGVSAQVLLGSALWENGEIEEAEAVFRRTSQRADAALAHQYLGLLLLFQGRSSEAVTPLRQAVAQSPGSPRLLMELARALEGSADPAEAASIYRRVIALDPEVPEAHYRLGILLARGGATDEGRAEMEISKRLRQEQEERKRRAARDQARLDWGWELVRQGRYPEAAEQFRLLPRTADTLDGLAAALAGAGDLAGAVEALEQALLKEGGRQDLRSRLLGLRAAQRAEPPDRE